MTYADTLQRCDTTAFITALALVAEAKRRERRRITILEVQLLVCRHFGLRPGDMVSPCRQRAVARPRQVAMFLCHEIARRSLPQIGRAFGGRDHTTVIHACRQVERLRAEDPAFDAAVRDLAARLSGKEAVDKSKTACDDTTSAGA